MNVLRISLAVACLWASAAPGAELAKPLATTKPVKVSAADAAGPVFRGPHAVQEDAGDGPAMNVLLRRSADRKVEMGLYEAGPLEQDIEAYDEDEFMFFISGGITLTSADGTVLEVKAGEGAAIPKGWKGHWSTKGYRKYYVTYTGGAKPK